MKNIINKIISDTRKGIGISSVLCLGRPGTGKTYFAEKILAPAFLQGQGEILFYQCHEGTGKEELLYDLDIRGIVEKLSSNPPSSSSLSYLQEGVILQGLKKSKNQKVVIILDEIDKARPQVDAFLLDLIQNCRIFDPAFGRVEGNPQNLILVLTSNQDRELSDALYRRLRRVEFKFPSSVEELEILKSMGIKEDSIDFAKFLLQIANFVRGEEMIHYISSYEIARIVFDFEEGALEVEDLLYWFSPYKEDWEKITAKYKKDYLAGMVKGFSRRRSV